MPSEFLDGKVIFKFDKHSKIVPGFFLAQDCNCRLKVYVNLRMDMYPCTQHIVEFRAEAKKKKETQHDES